MPRPVKKKQSAGSSSKIVRCKMSKKKSFELMVNPGTVSSYRKGKTGISNVLLVDNVFKDARKLIIASAAELKESFGTSNLHEVAEQILAKGDAQTSSSERKDNSDTKKRQIAEFIHRNYIDASTGLPIPTSRLLGILEKHRVEHAHDTAVEARKIVEEHAKAGDLAVKRREEKMAVSVPENLKAKATALFERRCSVLSRKIVGTMIQFELGCLQGEFDTVMRALEKLTANSEGESKASKQTKERKRGADRQKVSSKASEEESSRNQKNWKGKKKKRGGRKR